MASGPMRAMSEPSVAEMLRDYSVELVPGGSKLLDVAVNRLPSRALVSLTWIPGSDPIQMIASAARLRRAGLLVMPHIGARHLRSVAQLEQLAEGLMGEAGVDRVLIIGGDRATPAGPFDSSLAILRTGVFQRVGIYRVAVAGFPEGNPHIPPQILDQALAEKVEFARAEGLELSIVTQFCFAAAPIMSWLRRLRARNIDVPVRVGLAGPAGLVTLVRYAMRCGVGNSLHVLTENPSFARALADRGPEPILREMIASMSNDNSEQLGVAGLHFYLFGGLSKTLDWIDSARSRKAAYTHT
jgi:methylenetetrahydrofolate reductase (NADH)